MQKTLKLLYAASGNQCAYLDCEHALTKDDTNYSHICHIEAYNEGGARYSPHMTDEQRNNYDNLILLCPNHHKQIDENPDKFTVRDLRAMKKKHETQVGHNIIQKDPTFLSKIIKKISDNIDNIPSYEQTNSFRIEEKIEYNHIKKYRYVFQENKIYQGALNIIYNEFDRESPHIKKTFLAYIHSCYLIAKGTVLHSDTESIKQIQSNADRIYEEVKASLREKVGHNEYFESIDIALDIILTDAFMRCKIFEEPKDDH